MYAPAQSREDRASILEEAMRGIGFATLITHGEAGIEANHLPLLLDPAGKVLRGHLARGNPLWQQLQPTREALAVFLGRESHVAPGWCHGGAEAAVPAWAYLTVHARGPLTFFEDTEWLRAHVAALAEAHEAGRIDPWRLDDAPTGYIDEMLRKIVGFELSITRLEGKWRVGRNRSPADIRNMCEGLAREGGEARRALTRLMGEEL